MAATAQLVKDLRDRTGAGVMDCKEALQAAKGDLEAAVEFLRKKGLAQAGKRAADWFAEGANPAIRISTTKPSARSKIQRG